MGTGYVLVNPDYFTEKLYEMSEFMAQCTWNNKVAATRSTLRESDLPIPLP